MLQTKTVQYKCELHLQFKIFWKTHEKVTGEINFNDVFYLTPYSQNYRFNIIDRKIANELLCGFFVEGVQTLFDELYRPLNKTGTSSEVDLSKIQVTHWR